MAQVHKGRNDPQRLMRGARLLMLLSWPLAIASLALTGLFLWQCGPRLLALADGWRDGFIAWALAPGTHTFPEPWHASLWQALALLLRGVAWVIWGLTLALPPILGVGLSIGMACLFRPALRKYGQMRERVAAFRAAMKLLNMMPGGVHVFQHKRIVFEGVTTHMELILVSPGGVAVMEVNGQSGIIEGCVTDTMLRRSHDDDGSEKLRNPARQAVANVTRLSNYLSAQGISVWVTPCVLFVHPEASAYVYPPEETGGRRTRISSCVVTDATSFWEDFGRQMTAGRTLPQGQVDRIVQAIHKASKARRRD